MSVIVALGCGKPDAKCNGSFEWCDRPFNEVAQICTHNAMSSVEEAFVLPTPNQVFNVQRQLDDGVRCLMLDTYWFEEAPYLCHGICGPWGATPLQDTMEVIANWLDQHPTEIVTIIFQSNIAEEQLAEVLVSVNLQDPSLDESPDYPLYYHDISPGEPWPTLRQLIDENQRLLVTTDDPEARGAWHIYWPSVAWETPYADPDFPCVNGRGDPNSADNQLVILNHYSLCETGGCLDTSVVNNSYTSVIEHSSRCVADTQYNPRGQLPTFINVDHYHTPQVAFENEVFLAMREVNSWWTP